MRARGYAREETIAVGDSREDLACAEHVGDVLARRQRGRARPVAARGDRAARATCASPRPATAPGVYEAVVTTLMPSRLRRLAPLQPRHSRRQKPGRGRRRQRAGGGTVVRTSATQSSSGSSPAIRRAERAGDGRLDAGAARARGRAAGTDSSASTAWPIALRDLGGGHALGEQLAGAAVAALRRERGRDEVAGAGQPDHRLRAARRAPRRSARPRRRCGRRRRRRR